jgi:hypothetical protein
VARHRFDAEPDPDPTFHVDADPNPHPDSTLFYTCWKIKCSNFFIDCTAMQVFIVLSFSLSVYV